MAQKILLLSLSVEYGTRLGKALAENLDLNFFSIDRHFEQSLSKLQPEATTKGLNFFKEQESKAITECIGKGDGVFFASYGLFQNNKQFFQTCQKIYAFLPKDALENFADDDKIINQIAFWDRDKVLMKEAIKIDYDFDINTTIKNILSKIKDI